MGESRTSGCCLALNEGWEGVWSGTCDAITNGATCTVTPDEDCTVTYACIESFTIKNDDFRLRHYTAKQSQFVVMAIKSEEEIGAEVHKLDKEYFDGKMTK